MSDYQNNPLYRFILSGTLQKDDKSSSKIVASGNFGQFSWTDQGLRIFDNLYELFREEQELYILIQTTIFERIIRNFSEEEADRFAAATGIAQLDILCRNGLANVLETAYFLLPFKVKRSLHYRNLSVHLSVVGPELEKLALFDVTEKKSDYWQVNFTWENRPKFLKALADHRLQPVINTNSENIAFNLHLIFRESLDATKEQGSEFYNEVIRILHSIEKHKLEQISYLFLIDLYRIIESKKLFKLVAGSDLDKPKIISRFPDTKDSNPFGRIRRNLHFKDTDPFNRTLVEIEE